MLDLIKKEMSTVSAIGHVSQRLNARKLTVGSIRHKESHWRLVVDTEAPKLLKKCTFCRP